MSTVCVNYNYSSFKVRVSTNSNLNDVLLQSIKYFKLENKDKNWELYHRNKVVPLDLPWRLLNFPTGANLELRESQNDASKSESKQIKIRFQVTAQQALVETVDTNDKILNTIASIRNLQGWDHDIRLIEVQIFTKIYTYEELEEMTFASMNINESTALRVNIKNTSPLNRPSKSETTNTTAHTPTVPKVSHEEIMENTPILHEPKAYIPSNLPIVNQIQPPSDSTYELTVEHAKKYQEILSRQSGGLGGPLMTKRLREQMEGKNKKTTLKECIVRIKFPDRTFLEIGFHPEDKISTVYSLVSKSLINEECDFKLFQTHPHKYLESGSEKINDDLNFGARTVLLFECESSDGPFLKSAIMYNAESMITKPKNTPIGANTESDLTKSSDKKEHHKPLKSLNKVPKWMKLSKK